MQDSPAAREAMVKVTERYDLGAQVYRELWAPILRIAALPLVRELADSGAARVLDMATGVGSLLPDLGAAFPAAHVTGADLSRGMLRQIPGTYDRVLMDARQMALGSACFDRVFILFMLFHLDDPGTAVREAHRVLEPGGRIGTLTWAQELESAASRIWTDCLDRHGARPPDPDVQRRHAAVDSPAKMESLLQSSGFAPVRSWTDELVYTLDADALVRLKMNLGFSKARFDSLSPTGATACVEDARRRMGELDADGFIGRARMVYTTGLRPA